MSPGWPHPVERRDYQSVRGARGGVSRGGGEAREQRGNTRYGVTTGHSLATAPYRDGTGPLRAERSCWCSRLLEVGEPFASSQVALLAHALADGIGTYRF